MGNFLFTSQSKTMRGINRGTGIVKKKFNPKKFALFGLTLFVLCNLVPSTYFERRLERGFKDITTFGDAMTYAKQYSSRAKIDWFSRFRKFTQKYIGLDVFFIVFNLARLVIAMAAKDFICSFITAAEPKKKSLGRKLTHTMRSQVFPNATESDDDDYASNENTEKTSQTLGALGDGTANMTAGIVRIAMHVVWTIFRKIRMYTLFIYYLARMVVLLLWTVAMIPKGLFLGLMSGFGQSGIQTNIAKSINNMGLREIFFDSITEIFDDSDDDYDINQPGNTGAPANRDGHPYTTLSQSEDTDSDDSNHLIDLGQIDSTRSMRNQLRKGSAKATTSASGDDLSTMVGTRSTPTISNTMSPHLQEVYEWNKQTPIEQNNNGDENNGGER